MNLKNYMEAALEQRGIVADARDGKVSNQDLLFALTAAVRDMQESMPAAPGARKLYYFSAEFLVGRLLRANLINLGLLDDAEAMLAEYGTTLAAVEDCEPEPSLGNGGLGRLAACFMDSIASLGLRGDGVGLNYHYGLFHQDLSQGFQAEKADPWIEPDSWLVNTGAVFGVDMCGKHMDAHLYDLALPGYENGICNRLHLFDVTNPAPAPAEGIDFDKTDLDGCLTSFLYPDDSDEQGRILRVCQQYFMVSAGAQLILHELAEAGHKPEELAEYACIQINDTHPSMVIPEMIRLLVAGGMEFEDAVAVVEKTCNYTNHTILAEALEKWPSSHLERVCPQLLPIIRRLDVIARTRTADESLAIWDGDNVIHMAHMDVHFSAKVNGVASLHTQILEETEMHGFYELYPDKFNNKTNGITFRRWLMGCNRPLSELITKTIGEDWKRDVSLLNEFEKHADDEGLIDSLLEIKQGRKAALAAWLCAEQGIELNEGAVYDIQIKRLHQYKRQQMTALYAIWKYQQIKAGNKPARPLTMIFGAKAAPAYTLAKDTIHLLCCLSKLFASDSEVAPWLQFVVVENYNVTAAEHLIPAADISEQISLASKEASGTGNMKFMANGALTLGTLDGANVEISELVGEENIYLFGRKSEEVIDLYATNGYHSSDYWQRPGVEPLVDFILSPELMSLGNMNSLLRLYKDFIAKDYFMALLDVEDYIRVKEQALADYENREDWARRTLVNISRSGYFSSDRTISEYNRDIWHLEQR